MENRRISKKVPIILAIVWLGLVALSYLAIMVFTILEPQMYVYIVEEGWPVVLLGIIICVISFFFMVGIFTLSKKANLKWLKIVSLVQLLADVGAIVLSGLALLAYL